MGLLSERRFISKNNISSGMFLEFTYQKESERKTYRVVVIDPNRVHPTTNKTQLHALLIDNMGDTEILQLLTTISNITLDFDQRNVPITNLQSDSVYDKYKSTTTAQQRKYRTFVVDNMSNVRQILVGA